MSGSDYMIFPWYLSWSTMSDLAIIVLSVLAVSWSGNWKRYKFGPDQSLFTSLHVIDEEGQETVHHGDKSNIKEHVGVVKKILKIQSFCQGVMGHPRCHTVVLQFVTRNVHIQVQHWKFIGHNSILSKLGYIFVVWSRHYMKKEDFLKTNRIENNRI